MQKLHLTPTSVFGISYIQDIRHVTSRAFASQRSGGVADREGLLRRVVRVCLRVCGLVVGWESYPKTICECPFSNWAQIKGPFSFWCKGFWHFSGRRIVRFACAGLDSPSDIHRSGIAMSSNRNNSGTSAAPK